MRIRSFILSLGASAALGGALLAPEAWAGHDRHKQHVYARLVSGQGYGFCEFERDRRTVHARVWATGMEPNSVVTAWIFVNDRIQQLDGSVSTRGGDVELSGSLRVRRGVDLKIDVRDHEISIVDEIGNDPDDPVADGILLEELTTPAPTMIGTCTVDF